MAIAKAATINKGAGLKSTQVAYPSLYMRLGDFRIINGYNFPGTPQAVKIVSVTGVLTAYALATDPKNNIPVLFPGQEYTCAHVAGAPVEAELYTYIMALPEFAGCTAV